jgi:hypothetical protein
MTGSQLRLLPHKFNGQARIALDHCSLYLISTMARDDHRGARMQQRRRIEHVPQQRLARQTLKHFGQSTFHASTLTGSHDNNV